MIEKLTMQLYRPEDERLLSYEKYHKEYIVEKIADYHKYGGMYGEQLKNPEASAEKAWLEMYPNGFESYKEKDYGHKDWTAWGKQQVIDAVNALIDEVNVLSKLVRDAHTMSEVDRIGQMADSLKGVVNDDS